MTGSSGVELALFLGGIWAAGKGMLDASSFVNDLRDTVVIGSKGGVALTMDHRRVLRTDWLLTMIGTVLFPVVYSALLYVIADRLSSSLGGLHTVLLIVCMVPLTGSVLFAWCGVLDWKLMTSALHAAESLRVTSVTTLEAAGTSAADPASTPLRP